VKILIVDDTKSVHAYLKHFFSRHRSLEVICFYTGAELVEFLKTGTGGDLILLDWEMPVMTGPETLQALRALKNVIPVVMMTTKNAPEDIMKALSLGASEYVMKPFTEDILFEKIMMATGKDVRDAA
jgi:two-component system, chemotaxis family, chemotaxis protein CheY